MPTMTPPAGTPELLLAHGEFVQGLARTLLRDEAAADDLAQDAWVAALQNPPRDAGKARAWFGTVVRNLARNRWRARDRRAGQEAAAARPEGVVSASEVAEREQTRQQVVEAVLALDEPYRTAVLMRFYEDLPPRTIASRLGDPVETVKTRIKRGVAALRAKLAASHGGDRRKLCLALLPLAGFTRGAEAAVAGPATMAVLAVAGTAALGGLVWAVAGGDSPAPSIDPLPAAVAPATPPKRVAKAKSPEAPPAAPAPQAPRPTVPPVAPPKPADPAQAEENDPERPPFELLSRPMALIAELPILLQLRTGAGGGNPNRLDMAGRTTDYVDAVSATPLEYREATTVDDPAWGHVRGGRIPPGHAVVITRITYRGHARGDFNGDGEFWLCVGGHTIFRRENLAIPVSGEWTGRIVVPAGLETSVFLELANSSVGEAVLEGTLEPSTARRPSVQTQSHRLTRGGLDPSRIELSARVGESDGVATGVRLDGRAIGEQATLSKTPIAFEPDVAAGTKGTGWCTAGIVPPGQVLVLTRATWTAAAAGDETGAGLVRLLLDHSNELTLRDQPGAATGEWNGTVVVRPGDEGRIRLEVTNSSAAHVVLTGRFEPAGAHPDPMAGFEAEEDNGVPPEDDEDR